MSFLNDVLNIFIKYYPQLLTGVGNTLLIALTSTAAGLALGLLTGVVRTAPMSKNPILRALHKLLNAIIAIYVEIFRGTPMMVQSMVIYWGYAFATGGDTLPLIPSGILIVSINTGAYMAEIVRGGIISIDRGQFEGAMSIGMTHAQTMFKVIIPQVMRNILPSVSNEFVINIKDTSVLNVIGVTELYYFAGIIKRQNFQTFQTYLVVCILYFILTFTVTRLLRWVERKLDGNENYTIFGSQTDVNAELHITKEGCAVADNVIELVHLQKQFGDHAVLRDINLSVKRGEVLSIIGASGSGKSTMLRCINLLETPTFGQVLYHGQDITAKDFNLTQYRTKVGMVFQSFNLFNNMSALNNCIAGQVSALRRSRKEAEEIAMEYLTKVGMAPYINARPSQLSGGQKQRVAIARALAMQPEVLLFDEPTSALDPQMVGEVLDVMRRLAEEGLTMIVVTHEMAFARDVSTDVVYMSDGVICEQGKPHELFENPQNPKTREFLSRFHAR